MKNSKTLREFIKFNLVSFLVTVIQLVSVNLFLYFMKDWTAPLPGFLNLIFTPATVGAGNCNWGYVLPFFLSNALANAIGYLVNRSRTFHSDAPASMFVIFFAVLILLILFSTWFQGSLVYFIREKFSGLYKLAPTIASLCAGILQFAVLFPLEKFVLFKKQKEGETHA